MLLRPLLHDVKEFVEIKAVLLGAGCSLFHLGRLLLAASSRLVRKLELGIDIRLRLVGG